MISFQRSGQPRINLIIASGVAPPTRKFPCFGTYASCASLLHMRTSSIACF